MAAQPTGTVTLLFTDIEGSTRLLESLGRERYAEALELHRRLLRDAFRAHDGYEVDAEGDAFFVAFSRAEDAIRAAEEAQRTLVEADWPDGGDLRVRMGIHTGEPLAVPPKYVGLDVHRAARIMAAGHGGQVLVSQLTRDLLGEPADLRDLGEHRLKDLSAPQRLYQLGEADFPALKTLYRTNLPVPTTTFLGRGTELAEVEQRLRSPTVRLLTLVGPGGTGKTRLALAATAAAADVFVDGVTWIPLASLRDPAYVVETTAQALEVREEPGRPLLDSVRDSLAGRRRLLLFDNAEHLLPEIATDLAGLRDVEGPTLLVTSRERLRLDGEQTWPVPPLERPDAVSLFVARAQAVEPGFVPTPAVAELCRQLDNLPLAVELAAARVGLFSPEQLLERIARRLDLLKGARDADPRHATLRATIAWSYDLLDEHKQRLLRALSVFPAGCTFEAAETVCGADPETLESLIDKSLVRRRETKVEPRYWLLETIREFAEEQLVAADEAVPTRLLAIDRACEFAIAAEPGWRTPGGEVWQQHLALELDNLRQAMRWALDSGGSERALTIAALLTWLWQASGLLREGAGWIEEALAQTPNPEPGLEGQALSSLGVLLHERGDGERALELCRRSLPLLAAGDNPHLHVHTLYTIASLVGSADPQQAEQLLTQSEAAANALGDTALAAGQMIVRATFVARRDPVAARVLMKDAVALARGGSSGHYVVALVILAEHEGADGDFERARRHLAEARAITNRDELLREQPMVDATRACLELLYGAIDEAVECRDQLQASALDSDSAAQRMMLPLIDAGIQVRKTEHRQAIESWSRAEVLRESANASWGALEMVVVGRLLDPLRELLSAEDFAAAWSAGRLRLNHADE